LAAEDSSADSACAALGVGAVPAFAAGFSGEPAVFWALAVAGIAAAVTRKINIATVLMCASGK
jgi:hypothetical protein